MAPGSTLIGVWIGAIGTLALFSLIYKENKVYRVFEHLFIGLAAGYVIVTTWTDVLKPQWWDKMIGVGQWPWMFVLFLGLLLYTLYSKRHNWMSRIPLGIIIGLVAGQIFQVTANTYIPQIQKSFKPVVATAAQLPPGSSMTPLGLSLSNILFVAIVLCVLSYFFFSFEQRNPVLRASARTGRLMMMFAFGAIFGSTVMARMALLIDRVWFLMHDWLHLGH